MRWMLDGQGEGAWKQRHAGDAEVRKGQEAVLTQARVHEQGKTETWLKTSSSALMEAVRVAGMVLPGEPARTVLVKKLLAAGAKAEATNEVH